MNPIDKREGAIRSVVVILSFGSLLLTSLSFFLLSHLSLNMYP